VDVGYPTLGSYQFSRHHRIGSEPMTDRRSFIKGAGTGSGLFALGALRSPDEPRFGWSLSEERFTPQEEALYDRILEIGIDDTHCHPLTFADAQTTPADFLERISLAAFPLPRYFPDGVYARWRDGSPSERAELDRQYGIEAARREVTRHARETVFTKAMVKEMASYLGSEPTLEAVVEARNAQPSYAEYLRGLFRDGRIETAMLDMGYSEGLDQAGVERFEAAVSPTRSRRILRVDTIESRLSGLDLSFDEIERRFEVEVLEGLDGTGNLGAPSYGMKSYLLPRIGLIKPLYDRSAAAASWDRYRDRLHRDGSLPSVSAVDRDENWAIRRDYLRYLHSMAMEACLERDMPMQFHAGDGEAPNGIMRNQDPFLMEEMIRFERNGVMRMPKVILIHAGYPLVGKAAWICHLYANAYFELSLVTPLIHHGMLRMYLEVMEVVPLSKILFGSDAYHLPELYWLAARWGRRFLAQALGRYVEGGQLGLDEAADAARMILQGNNREVYGLEA
jgi:hypothetical protein